MKKFLTLVVTLLVCAQVVWSYDFDFEYDDFAYTLNDDGPVTLVGNYHSRTMSGQVVIPDRVLYHGAYHNVTAIKDAFYDNGAITSVSFGKNVRNIDEYSFYSCSGLQGTFTIPEGVTNIGQWAFANCSGLTGVSIPKSLTSVGDDAFYDCEGLTVVYITDVAAWCRLRFNRYSDTPLSFAHHLYLNGTELQNLEIPDDVTSISKCAFYNCTSLQTMSTGNGVDKIGWRSFWSCTNLRSITLGRNVKNIENDAFYGCTALTEIYSYIMEPFATDAFTNVSFYGVVTLHVPKGTYDKYNHYYPWYHCNIVEDLPAPIQGDVNGDGEVGVADVTLLVDLLLRQSGNADSDVNGDGETSISDLTVLVNILMQK